MPKTTTVLLHVAFDRAARLLRAADYGGGLNPAQWQSLRYLARCNRFSNSQKALGDYLAATKGTVSQTLAALVAKGLIVKEPRQGGGQSLFLTEKGRQTLAADPALDFLGKLDAFPAGDLKNLLYDLENMVLPSLAAGSAAWAFGPCRNCAHLVTRTGRKRKFHCGFFDVPLKKKETKKLCAHLSPRPEWED